MKKTRGSLFILTVLLMFLTGLSPATRAMAGEAVELLSYTELSALPLEKRIQYVEGVREILMDLSRNKNGRFSDSNPEARSRLKAWLDSLDSIFPEAKAQSMKCGANAACSIAFNKCFGDYTRGVKWNPGDDSRPGHYECGAKLDGSVASSKIPTSVILQQTEDPQFSTVAQTRGFMRLKPPGSDIKTKVSLPTGESSDTYPVEPPGEVQSTALSGIPLVIPGKAGPSGEASETVAAAAPPPKPRRTASEFIGQFTGRPPKAAKEAFIPSLDTLAKYLGTNAIDAEVHKCLSKERTMSAGPGTENFPACSDSKEALIAAQFAEYRKRSPFGDAPSNPEPAKPAIVIKPAVATTSPVTPARVPDSESLAPNETAIKIQLPIGDVEEQEAKARRPLEAQKETPQVGAQDAPEAVAAKPAAKPSDKSTNALAARLKSKYTCAPTPETCDDPEKSRSQIFQGNLPCVFAGMVSDLDSKNRRCQAVTSFEVGEHKLSCASGQTMCNPLLFGTVNATTPICIGRGQNATVQCSKLSAPRDAERFLNRNIAGLQDKWDDFREKFKKVCEPGTIQAKFHCVECNVMRLRLFELHARILSSPCGSRTTGESAVDARIRIRSAPSTK